VGTRPFVAESDCPFPIFLLGDRPVHDQFEDFLLAAGSPSAVSTTFLRRPKLSRGA